MERFGWSWWLMRRWVVDGREVTALYKKRNLMYVKWQRSRGRAAGSHHSIVVVHPSTYDPHAQRGVLTKDLTSWYFIAHDLIRPVCRAAWTISSGISIPSFGLTLTAEQSFRSSTPWLPRWAGQGECRVLNPAGSSAVAGCYIRTHCFVSCINTSVKEG